MRISTRLCLAALMAALLLAAAVGAASARSLSVSSQSFRATWSRFELTSSVVTIRCQLTLEGSFHARTMAKVRGGLVGAVTKASIKEDSCTNGRLQPRNLPWHITYEAFTGSLPNFIRSIRLLLARFRLSFEAIIRCEYGSATDNVVLSAALFRLIRVDEITELAPVAGANTINRVEPSEGFCSATANLVGPEGAVTQLGSTTRITITLI